MIIDTFPKTTQNESNDARNAREFYEHRELVLKLIEHALKREKKEKKK